MDRQALAPLDGLVVCGGGRLKKSSGEHHTVPFVHDFYDIELCTQGGFAVEIAGTYHRLQAGQLYVIPPHTVYTKHFFAPVCTASYLCVQWPAADRYLRACDIPEDGILFPHRVAPDAAAMLEETIDSLAVRESLTIDPAAGPRMVEMLRRSDLADPTGLEAPLCCAVGFGRFLSALLHRCGAKGAVSGGTVQKQYVESAARFLQANSHLNVRVGDAAAHIGIDRSYLFTLFRQEMGLSPQEYLIRCRIKTACDLLLQPQITVAQTALSVGYEPCAFSRAFKKAMGVTPEEYRRAHSGEV